MKTIKSLLTISIGLWLVSCSRHPSSLVGVWKTDEPGLISTQMVLTLNSDGTGRLNASASLMGVTGGGDEFAIWECSRDKLALTLQNGSTTRFAVLVKSKTDLVLQDPADGSLLNFKRIGDP
jgi:hypothetical protein